MVNKGITPWRHLAITALLRQRSFFLSLSHLAPHFQQQQKAASGSGSISNRALSMNKAILPSAKSISVMITLQLPSLLATWQPSTVQADSPQ